MTINPSASTLRAPLAAARIATFPCAAGTLAAVVIAVSACALQARFAPRPAMQPGLTGSALSTEFKPARHDVTARPSKAGDQDDLDDEDDAPEEPELQQIPMVPVADPQSLAV